MKHCLELIKRNAQEETCYASFSLVVFCLWFESVDFRWWRSLTLIAMKSMECEPWLFSRWFSIIVDLNGFLADMSVLMSSSSWVDIWSLRSFLLIKRMIVILFGHSMNDVLDGFFLLCSSFFSRSFRSLFISCPTINWTALLKDWLRSLLLFRMFSSGWVKIISTRKQNWILWFTPGV